MGYRPRPLTTCPLEAGVPEGRSGASREAGNRLLDVSAPLGFEFLEGHRSPRSSVDEFRQLPIDAPEDPPDPTNVFVTGVVNIVPGIMLTTHMNPLVSFGNRHKHDRLTFPGWRPAAPRPPALDHLRNHQNLTRFRTAAAGSPERPQAAQAPTVC